MSEAELNKLKNKQNDKRVTNSVNSKILKILFQTMWQLFGEETDAIINELNESLVA